jgi:PAS domain S-box-containing protein
MKSRSTIISVHLVITSAFIALYVLLAMLNLMGTLSPLGMPLIWLPAGFAAAAVVILGPRTSALGIWIGAFVARFLFPFVDGFHSADLAISATIATGALAQALTAGFLQRRYALFWSTSSRRGWTILALLAAAAVSMIDATFSIVALAVAGRLLPTAYVIVWGNTWLGNSFGIILITPALIWMGMQLRAWPVSRQIVLFVFDAGLILSIGIFFLLWNIESSRITDEFTGDAATAALVLHSAVTQYHDDVEIIHALYVSSGGNLTRQEFSSFVQHVTTSPGTRDLIWAPLVMAADRPAYEAAVRREGFSDFMIFERGSDGQRTRTGDRSWYVVADYHEPLNANRADMGFDMNSEPIQRTALERARDTGQAASTAPINLVGDSTPGVLIFWPIYAPGAAVDTVAARQANIRGYMIGVLRIHDLVNTVMQMPELLDIDLYLFDQNATASNQPFYVNSAASRSVPLSVSDTTQLGHLITGIFYATSFDVAGNMWQIITKPTPTFITKRRSWEPWITMLFGLAISGWVARALAKRQKDADTLRDSEIALRKSDVRLRTILQTTLDGFWIVDQQQHFVDVNDAYCAMSGYSRDEILTMRISDVAEGEQPEDIRAQIGQIMRVGSGRFESRNRCKDGSIFDVDISAHYISSDGDQLVGFCRDITERKRRENEIQQLNSDLEVRVIERTSDLSQMNAELGRALRTKDEFLSTMSHELRTPLNSVLSFTEILLEQYAGPLNERQTRSLQHIDTSGRHLLSLINDILDLSKIEAGRMDLFFEPCLVSDICESSLLFIRELAIKQGLHVSFASNNNYAMMKADAKRMKQMLVNLLSNAVKFTPTGGQIHLEVEADAAQDLVRFIVEDSEVGITPEDMTRLFTPFTQLDSSLTRKHEGTGLGLALVRRLADLHGGSVHVESSGFGKGSRFTITLPWLHSESESLADITLFPAQTEVIIPVQIVGEQQIYAHRDALILLAEDNDTTISAISDYLHDHHCRVVVARNGVEAIDRAVESSPDLILMDIQMPEMDGLEATRRLRAMPACATTPIIALTALAMPDDRDRCLEAGANEYLSKPLNLHRLVGLIDRLLGG